MCLCGTLLARAVYQNSSNPCIPDHQAMNRSHSHAFYRLGINPSSFYYLSKCIFHTRPSNRISTTHCSFFHLSKCGHHTHGSGFCSTDHSTVSCLPMCRFQIHLFNLPHNPQSTLIHQTIFHVLCHATCLSSICLYT